MGKYFDQDDVFPIIARLINEIHQRKNDWVTHEEIVRAFMSDPAGNREVVAAWFKKQSWTKEKWAGNMVAWFSQRITEGRTVYKDLFDREHQPGGYSYKPRRKVDTTPVNKEPL